MKPVVVAVAAIQLAIALPRAAACTCGPLPPCQAYSLSELVFLGTVTEVLEIRGTWTARVRMRIDRAYKGVTEESLIVFMDGMCSVLNLQLGEQYVMYAHRFPNGEVAPSGCSSSHVKHAEEDLRFLDGLANAPPTSRILGRVTVAHDTQSLSGATVEIRGPEATFTTTTDDEGRYSLDGLKPGDYNIRASRPGFRMPSCEAGGAQAALTARGCAVVDLYLSKDWPGAIEGRLIRPDGTPAKAGIELTLIRLEGRGESQESTLLFGEDARTNDQGEYSFQGVAPGRYKLVMHGCCNPTPEVPYPAIYWPAAATEAAASEIEITNAATSWRYDFLLPPELKSKEVSGVVSLVGGKPAAGAYIEIVWKRPQEYTPSQVFIADADGRFSFTAWEGMECTLTATSAGEPKLTSEPVDFSLSKGPEFVTLLLDGPGQFDENRAERSP